MAIVSRRWLGLCGVLLLAADWPGFLGPRRDGVSPDVGFDWTGFATGPRLVWSADLGEGYAAPSVANGHLFTFDRVGGEARVTCRDADTGAVRWSKTTPTDYVDKYGYDGGPRAAPLIDTGRVYLHGVDGLLWVLDADSGRELWRVDTAKKYGVLQNFFGVASSPLLHNGTLIVPVGGSPPGPEPDDFREVQGNGSGLVAFDAATGQERWRASNELASYSSPIMVSLEGQPRGLYWGRANLLLFDPANGKELARFRWRSKKLESVNASTPIVVGQRVLISDSYENGAAVLELPGLRPVWTDTARSREQSLACHWNTPVQRGGYVYACHGQHTNTAELRCVELATGKVMWRVPGLSRLSLTLVEDRLIALNEYGLLLLIEANPTRYVEEARVDLGRTGGGQLKSPCWAAPVVCNHYLYLRGAGKLLCFRLKATV